MNSQLSQRVAKLMQSFIVQGLTRKERVRFIDDISNSKDFNSLTKNSKTLIRKAEKELEKESERFFTD